MVVTMVQKRHFVMGTDLTHVVDLCTPRIDFGEQHPERGPGVEAQHYHQADALRNFRIAGPPERE